MTVLSYSNARKDFRKLIDKVNNDSDTVVDALIMNIGSFIWLKKITL